MDFTQEQTALLRAKKTAKIFLDGVAGTGKTTTAVARLMGWLEGGVAPHHTLVLVPQRTLATPYFSALRSPDRPAGGDVAVETFGSLTQTLIALFWALIAEGAGFAKPDQPPVFLSLEDAQYFMGHLLAPIIERDGLFDTVTQDRNRLYSQILDNLSKASLVDFPYTEIATRLKSAWGGNRNDPQVRVYDDVQLCANAFRAYCLQHNLLDFSLQVELLMRHLLPHPTVQAHLKKQYQYLVADNCEENSLAAHTLLAQLVTGAKGALVIADTLGGYRLFLGADLSLLYNARQVCQTHLTFHRLFTTPPGLHRFMDELSITLEKRDPLPPPVDSSPFDESSPLVDINTFRYYPQLTDAVAQEVAYLIQEAEVPPSQIAVLAPFLTDTLRFSLMTRLEGLGVPVRSHRPSRPLSEEPAALCLLHLACLAHPHWGIHPTKHDLVTTLKTALGIDLIRAQLMVNRMVAWKGIQPRLMSFFDINAGHHPRMTYVFGGRYEMLRGWLEEAQHADETPLDHFWRRLFGEVLSGQGYGFNAQGIPNKDMAEVAFTLIDSATQFRLMLQETDALPAGESVGKAFVQRMFGGMLANAYLRRWSDAPEAVLVAPAYTFLLRNTPVRYQFWLNIGDDGWAERVYQPLTNPYVLRASWQQGRKWTVADEEAMATESLHRLLLGLSRLCTEKVYMGISEWNEQGYEQRGLLLQTVHRTLRRLSAL